MSTSTSLALVHDPPVPSIAPPPAAWHTDQVLRACTALHSASVVACSRLRDARSDDRGQSTAEYALVILGAAAVAALLVAWAGQTNKISRLLDVILDKLINQFR
jgi:hypothetical protein